MKRVIKFSACIILIILLSGCAGSPYVLRLKQKAFALQPNNGMALFTVKIANSTGFYMNVPNYTVQEVNQYKDYKKLSSYLIPLLPENNYGPDGSFTCTLILPAGKYKINAFQGMITSFYQYQYVLIANKYIFDILPGTISYAGRINFKIYAAQGGVFEPSGTEDFYDKDVPAFRSIYPALQDKKVIKELFY